MGFSQVATPDLMAVIQVELHMTEQATQNNLTSQPWKAHPLVSGVTIHSIDTWRHVAYLTLIPDKNSQVLFLMCLC